LIYEEQSGDIDIALMGDAFITRRLSVYREPRFLAMRDLICQADFSLANAEVMFHRYEAPPVWDAGLYGTYVASEPELIDELKWLGIRMLACANNHAGDFGEAGVVQNIENLNAHGMPFAGIGRTLTEAVAPTYLDTPKGRVALVSVTCTIPALGQRPGDPLGPIKGRAGANVLRQDIVYEVPPAAFDGLREAAQRLRMPQRGASEDVVILAGQRFHRGEDYGREARAVQFDWDLNLKWIRDARRMADWVVVSVHCHERGPTGGELPEYARAFAHAAVEAGADVVHGHGPHQDRALEIYKGKPIFHALGNFIMQNDLVKWEPPDAFQRLGLSLDSTPADMYDFRTGNDTRGAVVEPSQWQSSVARVRFEASKLVEIRLHPVDLGMSSGRRSQRGRPVLAEGQTSTEILHRFEEYSAPFGTRFDVENGVGVLRVTG
jgi:poly-gamma-glutamate synthesis protein (capsule biosynthesis protein)